MAWSQEQLRNARIIYEVGMGLHASLRDIHIAITAAIVESGLRNLNYGDRDSIGMFQQRDAWGSRKARLDPHRSARMFFLGGAAGQRGLLDFDNRNSMSIGQAAQAVQVSAFPDRYAEHAGEAGNILNTMSPGATEFTSGDTSDPLGDLGVGGTTPGIPQAPPVSPTLAPLGEATETIVPAATPTAALAATTETTPGLATPLEGLADSIVSQPMGQSGMQKFGTVDDYQTSLADLGLAPNFNQGGGVNQSRLGIVNYAKQFLGTPYSWGGTDLNSGVDCSGLVQSVFAHFGINLPRVSYQQANYGKRVALGQLKPGDLVAWNNSSRNNGADHIAIYAGNGKIIEAPRPGRSVQLVSLYDTGNAWGVRLHI